MEFPNQSACGEIFEQILITKTSYNLDIVDGELCANMR